MCATRPRVVAQVLDEVLDLCPESESSSRAHLTPHSHTRAHKFTQLHTCICVPPAVTSMSYTTPSKRGRPKSAWTTQQVSTVNIWKADVVLNISSQHSVWERLCDVPKSLARRVTDLQSSQKLLLMRFQHLQQRLELLAALGKGTAVASQEAVAHLRHQGGERCANMKIQSHRWGGS